MRYELEGRYKVYDGALEILIQYLLRLVNMFIYLYAFIDCLKILSNIRYQKQT